MPTTPPPHVPPARTVEDPPVLRFTSPRDIAAYVPYSLGFLPEESLVLMSFRRGRTSGSSPRLGLVMRVDLPTSGQPLDDGVEILVSHLVRDGAEHTALVVYTDDPEAHDVLLREVERVAGGSGIGVLDVVHVGFDHWRSLRCDDEACCPPEGLPLEDLDASPVAAEMVLRGARVDADRWERLMALAPLDRGRVERVAALVDRAASRRGERARRARWEAAATAWETAVRAVAGQLDGDRPALSLDEMLSDESIAQLLCVLPQPAMRDALLMEAAVAGTARASLADPDVPFDVLEGVGSGALRPDADRITAVTEVLSALARTAEAASLVEVLGMLAWVRWWSGDLGFAGDLARGALEMDETHGLSLLVERMCSIGMGPRWIGPATA